MADDAKQSTRSAMTENTKRRARRPVLEASAKALPRFTVADYAAMSPLSIGPNPSRRGKKPSL